MRFLVLLLFPVLSLSQGQQIGFISPAFQDTTNTGQYAGNSQWPLGSTQVVAFWTPWEEFRLEFWQQDLAGGARLSSQFSYNQTADEHLPQSFQWTVQTYEFQLSNSPIFFFWLFNNANSSIQQSSAYFNITIGDTSSTSASPTSRLTPLPTSMPSSILTTSTTIPNTLSSASTSSTPISSSSGTTDVSEGLSAGAKAGIGVGASLGGILVLGITGFVCLKRKRLRSERQQYPELQASQPIGYSIGLPETIVLMNEHTPKPTEAPSHYNQPLVELG
ncbi:hypothetical protein GGR58DRAFT_480961 [Xylaria digitata]|nr:hypothetical protein GGR58DRAFT_480961 [Xylaria digitata]